MGRRKKRVPEGRAPEDDWIEAPKLANRPNKGLVFGRVVAERTYKIRGESVVLQFGTPRRTSWRDDFYCPFRIAGRSREVFRVIGVDSMQALELAMMVARRRLRALRPRVRWLRGMPPGDTGLAGRIYSGISFEMDEQLERRLQREIERAWKLKLKPARRRSRG